MGMMKDALLDLLAAIHPNDFDAQDELQGRLMNGQGLYPEEFARAQSSDVGRNMIGCHMVWEA